MNNNNEQNQNHKDQTKSQINYQKSSQKSTLNGAIQN